MLDPYAFDRAITSASLAIARARETLRTEPEATPERPLASHDRVSRREALVELGDLAERRKDEPAWVAALPHVRELTLSRATFVDERREAFARSVDLHDVESPMKTACTLAEMLRTVLETRNPALASAWARTLEGTARGAGLAALFHRRRRAEAARILEIDLDSHDAPVAEPALLYHAARGVLDLTSDVSPRHASWEEAVVLSLGRSGHEGYPAKLTPRWLAESLPDGVLDGLVLDVRAAPRALGSTSFARAFADVGAAIATADVPAGLPRCIARAPHDLLVARRGALLAGLVADAPFLRKRLGLSRAAAREQAAAALRLLLGSLRLDAARVLAREADPRGEGASEITAELSSRALGAPVNPVLAFVMPRIRPDDAARLVGAVVAASDRERIVDTLDEDWFASPRAADALRHEHHAHRADARASKEEVDGGLASLRRMISAL